jgi:glycosyltransferase involved in cell wall biosynthesis
MAKRICICATQVPFVKGGAEIHVESLRRELIKRDFDAEVVRVPVKLYPRAQIMKSVLIWRLLDLTESFGEKIDMVIATRFPSYAIKHPNKVVWLIHQFRQVYDLYGTQYSDFTESPEDQRWRQLVRSIDNHTLGEAKRIFTNSQNTANRLARYNELEGEALYHPPKLAERLHNQSYGEYVFAPSRLNPSKRIDLLVQAMPFVKSGAQCIIAGTGSDEDRLRSLAVQLNVSDRVKFTGYVDDNQLIDLYANCFAVYYAPYDEDFGYVTLEGFMAHKPIITASDSGGVLEFVDNGQNGYICGKADPQEIASFIDQLYTQRNLCREMGTAGYQKVQFICWDDVIAKLTAGL